MMNGRISGTLARHLNSFSTFPWPSSEFKSSEFGLGKESALGNFQFWTIILYILRQFCKYTVDIAF